ncbi:MAG: hypothetical protein AAF357_02175 [Verrucomicrobiota bacterium]
MSAPTYVITSLSFLCFFIAPASASPEPIMSAKGAPLLQLDFSSEKDMETIGLRKQSQIEVKDGILHATPPNMNRSKVDQSDKWADSSITRIHFPDIPLEFICQLRLKYNKPEKIRRVALDVGHRRIRTTLHEELATLQFLGMEGTPINADLDSNELIKLQPDRWYEITLEVKGDEILIQIGDQKLYGKHELITKHNAPSFNLDSGGAGFQVDHIAIFEVAGAHPNWETIRASLKE